MCVPAALKVTCYQKLSIFNLSIVQLKKILSANKPDPVILSLFRTAIIYLALPLLARSCCLPSHAVLANIRRAASCARALRRSSPRMARGRVIVFSDGFDASTLAQASRAPCTPAQKICSSLCAPGFD